MPLRLLFLAALIYQGTTQEEPAFRPVEVWIDTGSRPLAAYQIEITTTAKIAGLEGGDAPFSAEPYYDPAALQGGRIVIAAFTTESAPAGRLHVARLHMLEAGSPEYRAKLVVAAAPDGARFEAKIELIRGEKK